VEVPTACSSIVLGTCDGASKVRPLFTEYIQKRNANTPFKKLLRRGKLVLVEREGGMLLRESGTDMFVQDYVLTGYIAEVINTVSNLTYRTPSLLSHPLSSASSYFARKYQIT
jgi:hypothetical protein